MLERESTSIYPRFPIMDKHTVSTGSSTESFSSLSYSSSFSSADCNNIDFAETPSRDPQMTHQNLDLRDVVKDFMYRDARSSSDCVLNCRESLNAIANWLYDEPSDLSRSKSYQLKDGSSFSASKDHPRFSYNGRETNRLCFQETEKGNRVISSGKGPVQPRPPSVVAKLMGLDSLPDSSSARDKKNRANSQNSLKEPTSSCWKNPDLKPISRFPIEPAPWKQWEGARSLQKPPIKSRVKKHSPSSFYSEVDKRLKNLESTESQNESFSNHHHYPSPANTVSKLSRAYESPIVIMKPASLVERSSVGASSAVNFDEFSVGNRKFFTNSRSCKKPVPESTCRENDVNAPDGKTGGRFTRTKESTTNSRKRLDKHTNKQQSESSPPGGKRREKDSYIKKSDDQYSEIRVSVLDDAVYMDDSPSPMKQTNLSVQLTHDPTPSTSSSGVTSKITREKLKKIEHLVQKLKSLNSNHDEAHTDYIALLCENTNPDHRYISEILLASGLLLRDFRLTFQFHSSGLPINPDLFSVLEQTKFSNVPNSLEKYKKLHRKLIFDAVNEILVRKLASPSVRKTLNARKLLRDLCFEIERIQVTDNRESWVDYGGETETPVIVMEVERMIFKDLVREVVLGRGYRKLFSK